MDIQKFYLVMIVLAVLLLLVAEWTRYAFKRLRVERDVALESRSTALAQAKEATEMTRHAQETAEKAIAAADERMAQCQMLMDDRDRHKRRADSQFSVIEDACQERDAIWAMYRGHCIGSQAAQELLFSEIEGMHRYIKSNAERFGFAPWTISERLMEVLSAYNCQHADEHAARAAVEAQKAEAKARIAANLGGSG